MKTKSFLSIVAVLVVFAFTSNNIFAQAQTKATEKAKTENVKSTKTVAKAEKKDSVKTTAAKTAKTVSEKKAAHHKLNKKTKADSTAAAKKN
jgi:hypothetical protein